MERAGAPSGHLKIRTCPKAAGLGNAPSRHFFVRRIVAEWKETRRYIFVESPRLFVCTGLTGARVPIEINAPRILDVHKAIAQKIGALAGDKQRFRLYQMLPCCR